VKKRTIVLVGIVTLVVVGVAYYAITPVFVTITANDVEPVQSVVVSPAVSIVDTPAHPASGSVSVIKTDTQSFLRYENLKTINGPDLYIYLSTDLEATEFVSLGKIKATEGNVNYEIPSGTDLKKYKYALVWWEQFSVLFNYANVEPK
jgi:hypothetical protein